MNKLDHKQIFKELYKPSSKEISIVDVPSINFLMIDGHGDPNTSESFKNAIEALYSVAYALKFMSKKGDLGQDYVVMPLEGLWWSEDMDSFTAGNKELWDWTLMIMQPDFISKEMVISAIAEVQKKKNPTDLDKIKFEAFAEGKCAQILYIGPYSEEKSSIDKIHEAITEQGKTCSGKHHEIYISDARKTAPEKLKTILRQPFN
ncbi:GyrI-like domain-containing protein [Desulfovibrio gilichinskyi]|uniref:GyrI-like small molecule binding domain-containing protein n=1 Tax=Desulfovibrio gilichinskyi TaxID=1519643 RepID=A0A1X7EM43_9BACT|nr:GyrI-like domain-containing protein [Desulfovibrio gilichinskyi]SMF36319.1 hypothetical protein SAMN06295933_3176 [Desulfovibrio gilichinskyi]